LNPRRTQRPETVFESAADRSTYGRKRGFGSASVRLEALRCAEVGTKFGTKSLRCRVLTLIREREPRGRYQDRLAPADQPRGHVLLKGGEQFVQCAVSVSLTLDRLRVGRTLGADS
jgi:hypothetical protein